MSSEPTGKKPPGKSAFRRALFGVTNAMKLIRGGRFSAPYEAPFNVAMRTGFTRLRRYPAAEEVKDPSLKTIPILLVPPLMVTCQVYDISEELSALQRLIAEGFDVWVADFGVPEKEEGGMKRTLDEHLLAIDACIEYVVGETGSDVHLAGYSQGGMFIYQVTAYRKSRGVASIITFGSPVDLNRNVPGGLHRDLVDRLLNSAQSTLGFTLDGLRGVPGAFTSLGFKAVSPRQELRYLRMMMGLLDDREALGRLEPTRRFLGGEGFIAWPGPAFRSFVDNVIVHNRMMTGGFVVNGVSVTLSDVTVPILYFVGERDDFARPPSVRAVKKVVSSEELHEVSVSAGHFGLVVGSRSLKEVWPTTIEWVKWRCGRGEKPASLADIRAREEARASSPAVEEPASVGELDESDFRGFATELAEDLWKGLGTASLDVTAAVSFLRWQVPHMARLPQWGLGGRVNMGLQLELQASKFPHHTFFLYQGRAFTYGQANQRVNQVIYALLRVGVRKGQHVAIIMDNHPDYLTGIMALNRMGAVSVLVHPGSRAEVLEQALEAGEVQGVIVDPDHALAVAEVVPVEQMWLFLADQRGRERVEGITVLDRLMDPRVVEAPITQDANRGQLGDLAMLVFTSGTTGLPKAARISNGRWMMGAVGAAVAAGLTPNDTVYCCLPLYHATGLILGAGGAMAGGSRLALSPRFSVSGFWTDVRQSGATVVFYVGELCRYLVTAPDVPHERNHSVRLFFGNGMRPEVWRELLRRFGRMRVLEFYASTEGNALLANLTGEKVGSVGRPPPLAASVELVQYDVEEDKFVRDISGWLVPCQTDEPGMLISQVQQLNPFSRFEGYTDQVATRKKMLTHVFEEGDQWFITGDILRRDQDGDYWFVDRVGDTFRWKGENISTEQVASVVMGVPFVEFCAVYGVSVERHEGRVGMAAIQVQEGEKFDGRAFFQRMEEGLMPAGRPRFVRVVRHLEMTRTLKVIKHRLQEEGMDPAGFKDALYWYNQARRTYTRVNKTNLEKALESL